MKVAILTDSTAYIPDELLKRYNIYTVPLSVVFGKEEYIEGIDITPETFYQKIKETKSLPTTSQPSFGVLTKKYAELAKEYDAVISIHISTKLSGTFQAIESMANTIEGIKVYPYDSEITAMPQGFYAIEAAEMAQQNKTPEEIINHIDKVKAKTKAYFMVNNLSHLQRGGRIGGAQALIGSILSIKPILHVVDGAVVPFEQIRTRKKAINRIMDMLEEDVEKNSVVKVTFIHGNDEQSAMKLRDRFTERHPTIETIICSFGPVVGTHLGEGSIGVSWYTK